MNDYDNYLRGEIEKKRVAFVACVRQAIDRVDRQRYATGLRIGEKHTYDPAGKRIVGLWDSAGLRDYAGDIRAEICHMADEGDMTDAGITEHENLVLMTVEAIVPQVAPGQPLHSNEHTIVEVIVGVLGMRLELR